MVIFLAVCFAAGFFAKRFSARHPFAMVGLAGGVGILGIQHHNWWLVAGSIVAWFYYTFRDL